VRTLGQAASRRVARESRYAWSGCGAPSGSVNDPRIPTNSRAGTSDTFVTQGQSRAGFLHQAIGRWLLGGVVCVGTRRTARPSAGVVASVCDPPASHPLRRPVTGRDGAGPSGGCRCTGALADREPRPAIELHWVPRTRWAPSDDALQSDRLPATWPAAPGGRRGGRSHHRRGGYKKHQLSDPRAMLGLDPRWHDRRRRR
jgi:hypothetical protein